MKRQAVWALIAILGFAALLLAPSLYAYFASADPPPQVCPLSDSQQTNSQQAFATLAQMIKGEPRCNNCHGAVNPFAADTSHMGGRQDLIFNSNGKLNVIATRVDQCQTCHDAPWAVPHESDFFTNKDTVQLCKHFKANVAPATNFMGHMRTDQFSIVAFNGTRGLNDHGIEIYQDESQQKYAPIPPRFSLSELLDKSQAWIDAMGGKFQGDVECGCVPHHYALEFKLDGNIDIAASGAQAHLLTNGQQNVPLVFSDDGSFQGRATLTRAVTVTLSAGGAVCEGEGKQLNDISVTGKVDDQGKMHLKSNWTSPGTTLNAQCDFGGVTINKNVDSAGFTSDGVTSPLHTGLDMSTTLGTQQSFPFDVRGGKFTYTVTIVQLD